MDKVHGRLNVADIGTDALLVPRLRGLVSLVILFDESSSELCASVCGCQRIRNSQTPTEQDMFRVTSGVDRMANAQRCSYELHQ